MKKFLYTCFWAGLAMLAHGQTATLVGVGAPLRPMPLSGFNLNTQTQPTWNNTGFLDSVASLQMKVLRYPGGTISQYWDWQNGRALAPSFWVQNGGGPYQNYSYIGNTPMNPQTLESYHYALNALGLAPMITLNVLSRPLSDQLAMLHAAEDIGIPIQYIELGNEMYFTDIDFVTRYPTAGVYAREMNQWYDAIKADFPSANIAIIGAPENPQAPNGMPSPDRVRYWNDSIYAHYQHLDFITFHEYFRHGNTANPPSPGVVLSNAFSRWATFQSYSTNLMPSGMQAWFTEYNLNDNTQNYLVATTWLHGLFTAIIHAQMLADGRISILTNHQVTGSAPFASLDSYTNFGDTSTNRLTAEGNAMRLLHEAAHQNTHIAPLTFSVNPNQNQNGVNYPSLLGWQYGLGANAHDFIVINTANTAFNLNFNGVLTGDYDYERISASNLSQINLTTMQLDIARGVQQGVITIPAYAMLKLSVQQAPLPVLVGHWYGFEKNEQIELYWSTESESDCSRFVVERSTDALLFDPIHEQACTNDPLGADYFFLDNAPPEQALVYYRLKQIDEDMNHHFYPILAFTRSAPTCTVYPNPFTEKLSFANCPGYEHVIVNAAGNIVKTVPPEASDLSVQDLPAGVYWLQSNANRLVTRQLLIKH